MSRYLTRMFRLYLHFIYFQQYLTWYLLSVIKNEKLGDFNVVFEDIKIHKNLYITLDS